MATPQRVTTSGSDQQIVKGILTELDPNMALYLNGKQYTPAQLAAFVQRRTYLFQRIVKTKALWLARIDQYAAHNAELTIVLQEFRTQVFGIFGRGSPKVAAFKFKAPKKTVRTPEQNKLSAARARATREARGTQGPKARLKIKGTVEAAAAPVDVPPTSETDGSKQTEK